MNLTSRILRCSYGASRKEAAKYHAIWGDTPQDIAVVLIRLDAIREPSDSELLLRVRAKVEQLWGRGSFKREFPELSRKMRQR